MLNNCRVLGRGAKYTRLDQMLFMLVPTGITLAAEQA